MSHTDYKDIKVIGFDLDQTLYPKSPEIDKAIQKYIYEKIAEKLDVNIVAAKQKFDDLYQNGKISGSKALITLGFETDVAKNVVQEALENADIATFLKPNQEINELLKKLKNKCTSVDLLTGSSTKNALIKLGKLDILSTNFSHLLSADDGSKRDLSLYTMWLNFYPNLESKNFLYIGDRPTSDFEKPKELGIKSILVNIKTPEPNVDCPQLESLLEIEKYLL
jgi:FMN phosphatase YigB (HAD superfamily)